MDQAFTYNDVLIKPKFSEVRSREHVDLSTTIGNHTFKLPVISANMKDITGPKMASTMYKSGGLGILHRFSDDSLEEFRKTMSKMDGPEDWTEKMSGVGVSIGVQESDKEKFEELCEFGVKIFCIDVAHGHHVLVKNMLQWITNYLKENNLRRDAFTLIAGNIATPEAYRDLNSWGADAIKVGIGPSSVCRTRYNTGVGVPQLYALEKVYEEHLKVKNPSSIIADGGINHVGDIAKALKYADAVMVGGMISGTSETPGDTFRNPDGEFYKVYGGSASGENKGEKRFVEGVIKTTKFKGKVSYILEEVTQGLQGALSYVGANNLTQFQQNAEFVLLCGGARGESKI